MVKTDSVMLSAAKNLHVADSRFFAALSMTGKAILRMTESTLLIFIIAIAPPEAYTDVPERTCVSLCKPILIGYTLDIT